MSSWLAGRGLLKEYSIPVGKERSARRRTREQCNHKSGFLQERPRVNLERKQKGGRPYVRTKDDIVVGRSDCRCEDRIMLRVCATFECS